MKSLLLPPLLALPFTLFAAEESATELDPVTVQGATAEWAIPADIRGTMGSDLAPANFPLASERFDAHLALRRGNNTLRDVLNNSAGAVTGLGNGVHDYFVVRGIDSLTGALVLYDGLPEPEATIYPTYNIDAVEIVRGSGSFLHGPGAMAGSANIVRKHAGWDDLTQLHLSIGEHNAYEGRLDVNRSSDNLALRSVTGYGDRESHRDGVESTWFGETLSASWQLKNGLTLNAFAEILDYEIVPDAGVPVLGNTVITDDRGASFNLPGDFSEQQVLRFGTDLLADMGEWQFRNRLWVTQLDWDSTGTVLAGYPLLATAPPGVDTLVLARLRATLDDEQLLVGDRMEWTRTLEHDAYTHDILIGVEALRLTDEFTLSFTPASSLNTITGAEAAPLVPPIPANTGDATVDRISAFAYDQISRGGAHVFAGARVDYIDFEDDARGSQRDDTVFSPIVGASLNVTGAWTVFANAGRAYNLPSTQLLGERGEPEESTQFEAGLRWLQPDNPFAAQLTAFHLTRDQIAIPDSTGLQTQSGEQESQGIELELATDLCSSVRTRLGATIMESELTEFREQLGPFVLDHSGNDAPFAPDQTLTWYTEYQHAKGFGAGVALRVLGDHFISADNRFENESTSVVDITLFYDQPSYRVLVYLNNVGDEDVYTRGTGSASVIPEDGFNARAAVQIDL